MSTPSTPLLLVPNLLSEDEHNKQDKQILTQLMRLIKLPTEDLAYLVEIVITISNILRGPTGTDADLKRLFADDIEATLSTDKRLSEIIEMAAKAGKFKNIRNLGAFRKTPFAPHGDNHPAVSQDDEKGALATMRSWDNPYIGEVHKAFYRTIIRQSHYTVRNIYARYLSVVQSSGMGKSRMIDELSKEHFVIPINLRKTGTGFPPGDYDVSNFLTARPFTPEDASKRAQAFLTSLFTTTTAYLAGRLDDCIGSIIDEMPIEQRPKTYAQKFRLFMTVGSTFKLQGGLRQAFYRDVIVQANVIMNLLNKPGNKGIIQTQSSEGKHGFKPYHKYRSHATGSRLFAEQGIELELRPAAIELIHLLRPNLNLTGEVLSKEDPLIILAYDEAHCLITPDAVQSDCPTAFSEHQRVLEMLRKYPIFALFLSTTGKLCDVTPPPKPNRPSRETLRLVPPFSELGFDQMLKAHDLVIKDRRFGIDEVSKIGFMAQFGRPLWGSRYKNGSDEVRDDIVDFALQKLIPIEDCSKSGPNAKLGNVACMSVRLGLEFNAQTTEARTREMEQVEKHMRVRMFDGFETAVTTSPSEPLLAEAARRFMSAGPPFNMPSSLLEQLETMGLVKGDRGELVAEVLLILAADKAIEAHLDFERNHLSRSSTRSDVSTVEVAPILTVPRAVSVESFMKALLENHWHEDLLSASPAKSRTQTESERSFHTVFKSFKVYFTHFIKINDAGLVNREFLWRLAARGAAVMCADGQGGADIVIPIVQNDKLCRSNVSAIIVQVKNDKRFTATPNVLLFDLMNPYLVRFFDIGEKDPLPIIRMVFAFGSRTPCVTIIGPDMERLPRKAKTAAQKAAGRSPPYTSYDIWCAKASSETFAVIKEDDEPNYAQLLKVNKVFPKAYYTDIADAEIEHIRCSMNPGTSVNGVHWTAYCGTSLPKPPVVDLADEVDFGDQDDMADE